MADYADKRSQLHPTMPNPLCFWGVFRCHWSFFLMLRYSHMQRCLWKGITCWNGGRGRSYLQSLWHLQSEGTYWAPWTIIYHISDWERIQKNFVYKISCSHLGCAISYNKLHMFDWHVGCTCMEAHMCCILLPQKGEARCTRMEVSSYIMKNLSLIMWCWLIHICLYAYRIDQLPHWPGLMAFQNCLSISFMDGQKLEHLLIICTKLDQSKWYPTLNTNSINL